MFNGKLKKEAIAKFEKEYKINQDEIKVVVKNSENLQKSKEYLKMVIDNSWEYLNNMKNKPEELNLKVEKIKVEFKKFENAMIQIQDEFDKTLKTSAGLGAAGVAAGAGVAAFGPTAAMSIAMTFGTASTGTAISTLSGAAATKAALAWLGGGALAAGGGGISAGSAFLALAGPVGWAIGGTALTGATLFARSKNKKVANEAFEKAKEINQHTKMLKATNLEILNHDELLKVTRVKLNDLYLKLSNLTVQYNHDINQFCHIDSLMDLLGTLVNNTLSAAEEINRPIGAKG